MSRRKRGDGPRPYHVCIVRHYDPQGNRCKKSDPGATPRKEYSRTYYADLVIGGKRRPVSLKTTDEGQAWVELRRLQRGERERAAGITDRTLEHAARPLSDHVNDWCNVLSASGADAVRVRLLKARVTALATAAEWARLADVTADSCRVALGNLSRAGSRPRGLSAQTRNHYLSHARQFVLWAFRGGRLTSHPLAEVKPVSVETDRRHPRRCPSDAEVATLFAYLAGEGVPTLRGLDARQRALLYRTAMATGFRARELRTVTRQGIDLDAGTVTVQAAYSKRRKTDTQHVPPWLVSELRTHLDADGRLWETLPENHPGRVLKRDLRGAGVPYVTGDGFFDFHSLRHWYVTQVASQPDIDIRTLMELCRHSTPTLTLRVYAKAKKENVKKAVNALPEPGKG